MRQTPRRRIFHRRFCRRWICCCHWVCRWVCRRWVACSLPFLNPEAIPVPSSFRIIPQPNGSTHRDGSVSYKITGEMGGTLGFAGGVNPVFVCRSCCCLVAGYGQMEDWNPWAGRRNRRANYWSPVTDICRGKINNHMGLTGDSNSCRRLRTSRSRNQTTKRD